MSNDTFMVLSYVIPIVVVIILTILLGFLFERDFFLAFWVSFVVGGLIHVAFIGFEKEFSKPEIKEYKVEKCFVDDLRNLTIETTDGEMYTYDIRYVDFESVDSNETTIIIKEFKYGTNEIEIKTSKENIYKLKGATEININE